MKKKSDENIHVCGVGEALSDQELSHLSGGNIGDCSGCRCYPAGNNFEGSMDGGLASMDKHL